MKLTKALIAASTLIFAIGCTSKGFNREALSKQIAVAKPEFSDERIKDAYNKKTNLPKPFKLAIYFKKPAASYQSPAWRWTQEDKAKIDEISSELKAKGVIADSFPIIDSLVTDDSLKSLRLVAAQHGADALLIVSGATQFDHYVNAWGATYILILPTLFVPGSEVDTLFISNASMWDVKNEFLYLTSEAETKTNNRYIAAFGKREIDLVNDAKTKSLQTLKDQLKAAIEGKK